MVISVQRWLGQRHLQSSSMPKIGLDDQRHATARRHVLVAGSIYTLDTMHSLQRLSLGRLRVDTRLEGARQGANKCCTLIGF